MSVIGALSDKLKLFRDAHEKGDTDFEPKSMHHTLGKSPNQAAPGNHKHDELYERLGDASQGNVPVGGAFIWAAPVGAVYPENYLELDGATINYADYPALFDAWGISTSTTTLPDLRTEYTVAVKHLVRVY